LSASHPSGPEFNCPGDLTHFLSAITHDLKEPVRTLRCYADLLAQRLLESCDPETNRLLTYILEATTRLQTLIDDALAFALAGASGADRSNVDLEQVVLFVVSSLQPSIAQAEAVITKEPLPTVSANFGALVELFQNVIANAIKYHADVPPRIHIACIRSGPDWILSVSDNGIGIQREYQEDVFLPLKRLYSQQQYPGSGLGLAICKRIVESHGGRIWLESRPGVGTTVYFTLPVFREQAGHGGTVPSGPPPSRRDESAPESPEKSCERRAWPIRNRGLVKKNITGSLSSANAGPDMLGTRHGEPLPPKRASR